MEMMMCILNLLVWTSVIQFVLPALENQPQAKITLGVILLPGIETMVPHNRRNKGLQVC